MDINHLLAFVRQELKEVLKISSLEDLDLSSLEEGQAELIKGKLLRMGSTPFPRTVLKRLITSDPERQLYVASWDYGTVRCNRIRQLVLRSESGNAGDELAPA